MKYACRKTLADSRPRVRGRFAKNDEFEEPMRRSYSTGAYDDDGTSPMVLKTILCVSKVKFPT